MPKFVKDYLSPLICVLTLVVGMAYSSGAQDQRIKTLEAMQNEFKDEIRSLQVDLRDLGQKVAAQTQELRDQRKLHGN